MNRYLRCFLIAILLSLVFFVFIQPVIAENSDLLVEFFYAEECGHCEEKVPVIDEIEDYYGNNITVQRKSIDIFEYKQQFYDYGFTSTPGVVVKNQSSGNYTTFSYENINVENLKDSIEYHLAGNYTEKPPEVDQDTFCMDTPFGTICINASELSLPVLTIILGALDSVNPCAFFVLLFLLNLLLYAKSRRRMFIIGGIFIFFSGFIYFLLMALLLTAFTAIEQPLIVTVVAGFIALILGSINIKDFFFFKRGFSLSMSKIKRQKLFKKMRSVVKIEHLPTMIVGTVVLAIFANTYELACTLALPVVFTDILIIHNVPLFHAYLYILLYNVIYVIPLIIIVLIFVVTLGRRKLSEYQGRILKLFSGIMMFSFGLVMLFNPGLLKNVFAALSIILISIVLTVVISFIWKKIVKKRSSSNQGI